MEKRKLWLARAIDLLLVFLAIGMISYFFFPAMFSRHLFQLSLIVYVPLLAFLIERITRRTLGMRLLGSGSKLATTRAVIAFSLLLIISAGTIAVRDLIITSDKEFFAGKVAFFESEWVKFTPEEKSYSIEFPKKPAVTKSDIPLPRTGEKLAFFEAKCCSGHYHYSLSHIALPSRWLKWNSTLLMKGALKVINRRIPGAKVIKTSNRSYQKLPSLEYIVSKKEGIEVAGRLILKKGRLYKIEMSYPKSGKEAAREPLTRFIQSFSL